MTDLLVTSGKRNVRSPCRTESFYRRRGYHFSNLDKRIIEILWAIESADLAKKKQIAKTFAAGNQSAIKAHIEQIPRAETDKIWLALDSLRTERNLIVHGAWAVANDGRPLVVWHSKFLEGDDFIGLF